MVMMNSGAKLPGDRHCPRIDTIELKHHIQRRIGDKKAEKYFNLLNSYFSLRLRKSEFDKICIELLGRENISLHNGLIRSIIRNACTAKSPPPKDDGEVKPSLNVKHSSLQSLCRDVFPQSPRKGRTPTLRDRKFKDRPSPLGPLAKPREDSVSKIQEQSATEILMLGSGPPVEVISVEEGEEVEQVAGSPGIHSLSPIRAPIGVSLPGIGKRKVLSPFVNMETCYSNGDLPDTSSLRKRVEQKLATESLNISKDCVNVLNNGLDLFLKRLLKPCLELSASRSDKLLTSAQKYSVSATDFQAAMQLNPRVLGQDWPLQLEKVLLRAPEDSMNG